jgi:RNA polymerase sigma factor (sigma-70 family)
VTQATGDEFLLQEARRGDQDAFLLLYERYRLPIFRFLYRLCGSTEVAEEITHNCFLTLITEHEKRWTEAGTSFVIRLYSIARKLAVEYLRNSSPQLMLRGSLELIPAVGKAVVSLPLLEREALILSEYEGLELNEISTIVGANENLVAARLESARKRLRDILAR